MHTSSEPRIDRWRCIHTSLAVMLAVTAGCRGLPKSGTGAPLAAGVAASSPASGLAIARAEARGALAYAAAFSPDGETLASVELFGSFALVTRRADQKRTLALGPATYDITGLTFSPTGDVTWVASRAGTVRAFDLASQSLATAWHLGSPATAVAISPDGAYAAMGTASGVVCLRRIHDGALLQCLVAHAGPVSSLDISASGSLLASASYAGELRLWDLPSLARVAAIDLGGSINDIALSPSGERIAIARSPFPARLTPALARKLGDGALVARGRVDILPATLDREAIIRLPGHERAATAVAWLPRGTLVSGGWDGTVKLWDPTRPRRPVATLTGLNQFIRDIDSTQRGDRVAVAAWAASIEDPALFVVDVLYPRQK